MLKVDGTSGTSSTIQRREEPKPVQATTAELRSEPAFGNSLRNDTQVALARFRLQTGTTTTVAAPAATPQTPAEPVDQEKVEEVFDRVLDAEGLAWQVSDENTYLNAAEKTELIAMAVRSDRANELLTFYSPGDVPNRTYDAQQQIASAIGDAYEQGAITDTDMRGLAQTLGDDDFDSAASQRFVTILAQDPDNLHAGGVVEAFGRAAQGNGQDQAAALAFSSSEELIRANLTTTEARQDAYEQVTSFLGSEPMNRVPEFGYGGSPMLQSAYVQGLTNAARLHSRYGVSTDQAFDALIETAGPRYVQEAIARSGRIEGDDGYWGALNEFGDASRRLAQSSEDDRHDWNVNAALAYTQSEALINSNLRTSEQRMNAFDLLNHELAGYRDDAREAAEEGYSLLRAPAMADGLAQLLESHPEEILNAKLGEDGKNYSGQADLINLFQSTLFSPYTSESTRSTIETAVESYIDDQFTGAGNDSQVIGNRLGSLLGVMDAASQHAINAAKKPEEVSFIDQASRDFAKTVLSAGANALLKGTGPVGSLVGGFLLGKVLDKIFKNDPPSPDQLGDAYVDLLEETGQNISLGEGLRDDYINLLTQTITSLNELRDTASGRELADLTDASLEAGQLLSGLRDGYGEIIDSYQLDNGQINRALDGWSDDYEAPDLI